MSRFWVYIDSKIQGPVDIPSLRKVPGFNLLTQVCVEGEQSWRMADDVIEIKSYFLAPPRPNSFALDTGNAAPKLDVTPAPLVEEFVLPEADIKPKKIDLVPKEAKAEPAAAGSASLRAVCDVCGYKNPRDVAICMKCGESLKGGAATPGPKDNKDMKETPSRVIEFKPMANLPGLSEPTPAPAAAAPAPAMAAPAPVLDPKANTMVEIPVTKLVLGIAIAALVSGGSFFGYRSWTKKHHKVSKSSKSVVQSAAPKNTSDPHGQQASSAHPTTTSSKKSTKRYDHPPAKQAATSDMAAESAEGGHDQERSEGASYRVIPEATPLQKRHSAPVSSPYAVKRRANEDLWETQEGHAIQQTQRYRVYGGLRTIERNAAILMQILRDREYNTAFESGKRLYLYNDVDWSAVQKEGPIYEVRLIFSGGKETDGSPKKPLRFAFAADLERGTVEPGGEGQVRSNTLHAFFDESRIAPEDRRSIAKDTEELVMAAQPGASPLALDTVVRQFAKVYSIDALSRVSDAYGFKDIKKKLQHDPRLGSEDVTETPRSVPTEAPKTTLPGLSGTSAKSAKTGDTVTKPVPMAFPTVGKSVDFRMEKGDGREKTFLLRARSSTSAARLWEQLTGYDRLKQFMPDMLVSEREGQDGAAVIVHLVCLTRHMFLVFKQNVHLRVIEHPQQYQLEFERIAGDFESFKGSIQIIPDPATKESQIVVQATLIPKGHMLSAKLESMARRLFIPQLEALRAKAESN